MRRRFLSSSSILAALLLSACAVGPDFAAPPAPDTQSYDSAPAPVKTADGAQNLAVGQDIPAQWWGLFHSPALNKLVIKAVKNNPNLSAAEASLRVAQDDVAAGSAALFPTLSGSFTSQREKSAAASSGGFAPSTIYTLHNASINVSYGIDLFGGTRRAIEQLQAQADQARFEREAAYLTLTGNVVTAAIQEASLREQIAAARAVIADEEKILAILKARFDAGAVAKSAVSQQAAAVASAKTVLPPLEHQLVVTRHALSALVGDLPSTAPADEFSLATFALPQQIPVSVPAKLVDQRPDIREALENLHAASAAIGIAEAARLPEVTLSADVGSMANMLNKLFTPGGGFWSFGGSAAETIFDAGALADKEDAARDAYDVAAAQYRQTVVTAFQDTADALHALEADAQSLNAQDEAEKASAESLALTEAQFKAGAVTTDSLLAAEQAEQQAKSALVKAKAQRFADTAALFTALGGGWWNRDADNTQTPEPTRTQ